MSFASFSSVISSLPATLQAPSPLSELSNYGSDLEELLAEEYTEERDSISPVASTTNGAPAHTCKKQKNPPPSSWVWGPPESANRMLVTINDVE